MPGTPARNGVAHPRRGERRSARSDGSGWSHKEAVLELNRRYQDVGGLAKEDYPVKCEKELKKKIEASDEKHAQQSIYVSGILPHIKNGRLKHVKNDGSNRDGKYVLTREGMKEANRQAAKRGLL